LSNIGVILKIKEDMIIVMTSENDFISIKIRAEVTAGQQICFEDRDIITSNKKK
jgi:hypothetical protein